MYLVGCAKGESFTPTELRAAEGIWKAQGFQSYALTLEISGDNVETGLFEIEVNQGDIIKATRNGDNLATTDKFYTVDGIFAFLENELELGKEPGRYFGAAPGARIYMRAHFDSELGYPTRYLRAVTDTKHNITVEVKRLKKL